MTHDELRVDISIVKDLNKLVRKQMKAIDAIFELHKPVEDNRCQACYREEYFGGQHLEIGKYPCATIQAIEKELG